MYIYASDQDQDLKTFYFFIFFSGLDLVNIRNCECCLYREKSAGWWWGNVLRHSLFYRDQVSLWLLICCRGGYWLSNKMFPPNKCFHYISIIDGAWVGDEILLPIRPTPTVQHITDSTKSFNIHVLFFSSLESFHSFTEQCWTCWYQSDQRPLSPAFPSQPASNELWWGGGPTNVDSSDHFLAWSLACPAPGYSQYPGQELSSEVSQHSSDIIIGPRQSGRDMRAMVKPRWEMCCEWKL